MSWIALVEADVLRKLAAPELDAARTAVLDAGQDDPLAGVITEVTREVRARVAACSKNTLGPAGTIPDECEAAALARIRFELSTRLPGGVLMDEDRRRANADAIAFLRDVAACNVAIEQPATVSDEVTSSGAAAELVSSTTRKATRTKLSGL